MKSEGINMKDIICIKSRFKDYTLEFVNDFSYLHSLVEKNNTFFVFDRIVYELYKLQLPVFPKDRIMLIDAIESKKNIDSVLAICEKMTAMSSKRNTHLISVGGGITQDITGFVATSLYRGIKWTFYPTTLLAACDSCIGGKSSLNYKGFKNLLGTFYPPDKILVLLDVFKTLSNKDYCSGLGEVVKFNVIAGNDFINKIENDIDDLLQHDYIKLTHYIKNSLNFKKQFIEEDEFDTGIRILLNFAHTFGHAYETISNYAIPHGSAVALGMITANNISVQREYIKIAYAQKIENICKKILVNVKLEPSWFELEKVIQAIKKDKKQTDDAIKAVLIDFNYKLNVFNDITVIEIEKAIKHMLNVME